MEIGKYSLNKLRATFSTYTVAKDYADPIINYLIYGFSPGGFFSAVLANDFSGAISHSHPANTIPALKDLNTWILNHMVPGVMWGSYDNVNSWLAKTTDQRRAILVECNLIFTPEQETFLILKDAPMRDTTNYEFDI